jgi:hypothetical protein
VGVGVAESDRDRHGSAANLRPNGCQESAMTRYLFAVTLGLALAVPVAHAQDPESGDNRYQFNKVEDGYLRLDLKSGQVSLCSRRDTGWSCLTVPDDRAALDNEIARLQTENATLKKTLLDKGLPLPGGVARADPATRNGDSDLKLPSDADIDRVMTVVERMWRRLVEMTVNLQKDLMKKE